MQTGRMCPTSVAMPLFVAFVVHAFGVCADGNAFINISHGIGTFVEPEPPKRASSPLVALPVLVFLVTGHKWWRDHLRRPGLQDAAWRHRQEEVWKAGFAWITLQVVLSEVQEYIMDDLNFVCPTLLSSVGYVGLAVGVHVRARFGAKSLRRRAISFDQVVSILMPFGTCSMMGLLFREGAYLFISSPLANVIESFSVLVTLFYVTAHSLEIPTLRRTAAVLLIAVSMALAAGYESTADRQERLWFWAGVALSVAGSFSYGGQVVYSELLVTQLTLGDALYWGSPLAGVFTCSIATVFEVRELLDFTPSFDICLALCVNVLLASCLALVTTWFVGLVGALTFSALTAARGTCGALYAVVCLGRPASMLQCLGLAGALIGLSVYDHVKTDKEQQQRRRRRGCHDVEDGR